MVHPILPWNDPETPTPLAELDQRDSRMGALPCYEIHAFHREDDDARLYFVRRYVVSEQVKLPRQQYGPFASIEDARKVIPSDTVHMDAPTRVGGSEAVEVWVANVSDRSPLP